MPTTTSPPILVWTPGGGIPVGPISNPPVYSQNGTTQLVAGQSYIDVVFGSVQTDTNWVLVACDVENTTDANPLNIWPGIVTNRTTAGFRVWLNGMPDSSNYYLHWAVSGVNITPVPATTYLLTGPSSGGISAASTFTVALPPSTTLSGPLTVTPNDSGGGGAFSPVSVVLTTTSASVTFTYTPASYGAKTISVTNSGTLINPANLTFTPLASTYTLSGPISGTVSVPSTNFTVALPAGGVLLSAVTITPNDSSGGGAFTPTTVNLSTGSPSATFTYTPASTGAKTIGTTNSGTLTNPTPLTYTATAPLGDGAPVSIWHDSSGSGNHATQSGTARPVFKTAIIGGKPVVRFVSVSSQVMNLTTPLPGVSVTWTIIAVMAAAPTKQIGSLGVSGSANALGPLPNTDGSTYMADSAGSLSKFIGGHSDSAFHVWTATDDTHLYLDGTSESLTFVASGTPGSFNTLGAANTINSDGDVAEVIYYNSILSSTNRANVEKYLGTKYGITVAGGSAVDPSTISGLLGWWKADAI